MQANINISQHRCFGQCTPLDFNFIYGTSRAGAPNVCAPHRNTNYIYHFTFSLLFAIYHGITSPLNRKNFPLSSVVAEVNTLRRPPTLSLARSGAASPPILGDNGLDYLVNNAGIVSAIHPIPVQR